MNVVYYDVGGPNKFLEEYAWWYNKVQCWICLLCSMLHHCTYGAAGSCMGSMAPQQWRGEGLVVWQWCCLSLGTCCLSGGGLAAGQWLLAHPVPGGATKWLPAPVLFVQVDSTLVLPVQSRRTGPL